MMQDEENFNRFIKEKLEGFIPEKSPEDWKLMKRKLLVNKTLRFLYPTFALLFLSLVYVVYTETSIEDFKFQTSRFSLDSKNEKNVENNEKINPAKNQKTEALTKTDILENTNKPEKPIFPELFNETNENFSESSTSEIKVNKITNNRLAFKVPHYDDLAEKEIRFMATSATSMSDKISRVRELGKTYELTSYDALDRNIEKWKNIVLVCDITSSMFPYTTQVFDWMTENNENTTIKGIVFFTDCDSLGRQSRGRLPGKMYSVRSRDELVLWDTMFAAIRNTENNKDKPENNIEALLFAQKQYPDADEFVLIADNSSQVKDMRSLSKIKKKVHIILCGETYEKNYAFQSDYIEIAKKTKGSIHTLEDDIEDVSKVKEMSIVRVGNIYFRFHKGKFYTTKFLTRPNTPNP
jgi:hypothetical protein